MGADGWHFTTGPAVIVWRDADATAGAFHSLATFTQTKAPMHPEAYGMFIAGKDLKSDTFSYTYFIIRGDGKYLVKNMAGGQRHECHRRLDRQRRAWSSRIRPAKRPTRSRSQAGKDGKVSFKVNGKEVHSMAVTPGGWTGW